MPTKRARVDAWRGWAVWGWYGEKWGWLVLFESTTRRESDNMLTEFLRVAPRVPYRVRKRVRYRYLEENGE